MESAYRLHVRPFVERTSIPLSLAHSHQNLNPWKLLQKNAKMANKQEIVLPRKSRGRSVSEPSLKVYCGNYLRDRSRKTDLDYEKGKDKIAHWIGSWGYEEVRTVNFN